MSDNKKKKAVGVRGRSVISLRMLLFGATAAVLVVAAAGIIEFQNGGFSGKRAEAPAAADIDPAAGEWDGTVPQAPKGDPDSPTISVPGYPTIYLPAGQTDVEVAFANPEGNPCYFTFQLVLKDTGEILYESKQVPPGEAITRATLTKALDAGEYPAVLKISTASITDQSAMNGADMETILQVQ